MIARLTCTVTVVGAWTTYLTYAAIVAMYPTVTPIPDALRAGIIGGLVTGTLSLILLLWGRRLLAEVRNAHGLDIVPRRDEWGPPIPGSCRNTPRPESDPLAMRIVRPAGVPADDSPTLDFALVRSGPATIHPTVMDAVGRIARELRGA